MTGITTLDTVTTFAHDGPGITTNQTLVRPLTWCKQIDDITINGDFVTKDRVEYEPSIYPVALFDSISWREYGECMLTLLDLSSIQRTKLHSSITTIESPSLIRHLSWVRLQLSP